MPDYLLLHLKKFTLRDDWTPVKLDVAVEIPDNLDINFLRGSGLLPNEELLPEMTGRAPSPPPMDQVVIQQLVLETILYIYIYIPILYRVQQTKIQF